MSGEFTGFGFAVGSVRGQRSWQVDELGRLCGVTHADVWRPDENVAVCHRSSQAAYFGHVVVGQLTITNGTGQSISVPAEPQAESPADEHSIANCTCGFYSYFAEQANPHHREEFLTGVVEGYGKTVIGSQGFRAEKARIIALCRPELPKSKCRHQWLTRALGNNGAPGWPLVFSIPMLIGGLALTAGLTGQGHVGGAMFTALFGLIGLYVTICCFTAINHEYQCTPDRRFIRPGLTAELVAKVERNYPDVKWFDSEREMLAEFPTNQAPTAELTPETDPDFWTREAHV